MGLMNQITLASLLVQMVPSTNLEHPGEVVLFLGICLYKSKHPNAKDELGTAKTMFKHKENITLK